MADRAAQPRSAPRGGRARTLPGRRFEPMTELAFRDRGLASRRFRGHDEAAAERREGGFELFEADGVIAVEDMGDLLRGPAQLLGQLRRVEPGLAHRAVDFELGR